MKLYLNYITNKWNEIYNMSHKIEIYYVVYM